jgi:dihydrofolate synthase/folylpolyglutamate synthase
VDYQEAIDFLFPLHRFGIKPGFERINALLQVLGAPEKRLGKIVHIAGTNGKGTVAACMASIFQAAGRKTGLFTSPHLVEFTERIRIDGREISRRKIAEYCTRLKPAVIEHGATFFEVTTAMAFAFFAEEGVDVSVIETGMGGRLDATNVVRGEIVIIPSIGLDHTAWLGETEREIASEKAAIIKPGSRVYTAVPEGDSLDEIRKAVSRCGADLFILRQESLFRVHGVQPGQLDLEIRLAPEESLRLKVPLTGSFHASNVTLAAMAAYDAGISARDIAAGLSRLTSTGYRARLERVSCRPFVMLDVSHNPVGMQKTVEALREIRGCFRSLFVLIGVASDKDALGIVRPLVELASLFVTVELPSERTLPADALGAVCLQAGAEEVRVCHTSQEGMELLCALAGPEDMILVTGSFFLAGEVTASGRWCDSGREAGTI